MNNQNELITKELEKEISMFMFQGYGIFKKFMLTRKQLQETCSKCNSNNINTLYCNRSHDNDHPLSLIYLNHINEILHKRCITCSYQWNKACINK